MSSHNNNSSLLPLFLPLLLVLSSLSSFLVVNAQSDAVQLWSKTVSDNIYTSPIVSEKYQLVFFGSGLNDGQLRAHNIFSGAEEWTWFPGAGSEIFSTPAIYNESFLIVGSTNAKLASINISSGLPVWQIFLGAAIRIDPFVSGDVIYVGSDDKVFVAINAKTGSTIWSYTAPEKVRASPVVNGTTVIFGCFGGQIIALNTTTGTKIWNYTAAAPPQAPMMVSSSGFVVFGTDDGDVYGVFVTNGLLRFRWKSGAGIVRATPAELNGLLYLGISDGALHVIENSWGVFQWKYQAVSGSGSIGSATLTRGFAFFAASDGKIRAINSTTGQLDDPRFAWNIVSSVSAGYPSPKPVYVGNGVVIGVSGPTITAVSDPTVITTTTPPNTPPGGSTTTATTRPPYSTYVSNPADILLASSVPSAIVALILFPMLAFLEF